MKTMSTENQTNRVSKKFYAEIISRIDGTFGSVLNCPDLIPVAVKAIDRYIADGTIPQSENILVTTAFLMIKSEIDKAAVRSRRARESANRRRKPNPEMVQPEQISSDDKSEFVIETTGSKPIKDAKVTTKIKNEITKYKVGRTKTGKKFGIKIIHKRKVNKNHRHNTPWRKAYQ